MSSRKAFALRIDSKVMAAMHRWADDDLRSVNAQIEFVLREALIKIKPVKSSKLIKIPEKLSLKA